MINTQKIIYKILDKHIKYDKVSKNIGRHMNPYDTTICPQCGKKIYSRKIMDRINMTKTRGYYCRDCDLWIPQEDRYRLT